MRRQIAAWTSGLIAGVVLVGSFTAAGEAAQGDRIKVVVTCPVTLPAAGGTLNLALSMTNTTSAPLTVAKSGLAVHVGNQDVLGPFAIPITPNPLNPNEMRTVDSYVSSPYSAGTLSAGTFATVGVMVMDAKNTFLGSGFCLIQVI